MGGLDNGDGFLLPFVWVVLPQEVTEGRNRMLTALSTGAGYFMYFNTSSGVADEAALLESRILYPKRKQQCLQFFYKMTGSPTDKLSIWVRREDNAGNARTRAMCAQW